MNKPNVTHITEIAGAFQQLAHNYGGIHILGGEQQSQLHRPDLTYLPVHPTRPEHNHLREFNAQSAGIVPIGANFDTLATAHGREFGILKPGEGIFPAVVTPLSRPFGAEGGPRLHIAYLTSDWDKIDPQNIARGAADPLNALLLQTASTLYGPTIAAHGKGGLVVPGELGHRYGGLRTLSDPNAHEATQQGKDVTDELAVSGTGLATNITQHSRDEHERDIPGAFDMVDGNGRVRRIQYATAVLGPGSGALLIDHPKFNRNIGKELEVLPAVAATGLAIIAKINREEPVDPRRAVAAYGQRALGLR